MSQQNSLHVIFGNGPLGRAVLEELIQRGNRVRVVNRSGHMAEAPAGIELVSGDLYDPACVRLLAQGAAIAYQCAQPAYHEWPEKFPALQGAILEGLRGSGTRLVLGDNLYMYGDPGGSPLTEDRPYKAHTRKGRTRAALAEAAFAAHRDGRVWVTAGRGSDFFGPGVLDSTMGDRVFRPALAGRTAQLTGRLDVPHTYTYIRDFGRAMVILGENESAGGQAWHVPNDRPQITQGEFMQLVYKELGLSPQMSGMGRLRMSLGGLFIPAARETVEMMYAFERPFMVDSSKFAGAFGMKATALPEAIRETVAWFRAHPQD